LSVKETQKRFIKAMKKKFADNAETEIVKVYCRDCDNHKNGKCKVRRTGMGGYTNVVNPDSLRTCRKYIPKKEGA